MFRAKQSSTSESLIKMWVSAVAGAGIIGGILLMILVGLLLLALLSVCVIWSLNTLFGLGVAYTWETMLAVFILIVAFGTGARINSGSTK